MNATLTKILKRRSVTKSLLAGGVVSATNGIVIADAQAPDQPLIYVNPAFEKITGYTAAEVVGRNCRFLQGGEPRQQSLSTLRRAITTGRRCTVVLRNYRKSGELFWNELYIAPIKDADGTVTHFIGVQNDVTRRMEAENRNEELLRELDQRNRELEELDDQKNALLGMAAHDIRNPLGTILLNVDMLKRAADRNMPESKRQELTARIGRSATGMLELINSLLDVSKIEAGKMSLELRECDIRAIIRDRIQLHRECAAKKEITIRTRCDGDLPQARVDPERIGQVLDNLVTNAIKFSYPQTTIHVATTSENDIVRVTVTDQGQGIPEEEQAALFKPFSKTSVRTTGGESSSGLGLSICRKIVEVHQGTISVKSHPGKGSTFSFTLPRSSHG